MTDEVAPPDTAARLPVGERVVVGARDRLEIGTVVDTYWSRDQGPAYLVRLRDGQEAWCDGVRLEREPMTELTLGDIPGQGFARLFGSMGRPKYCLGAASFSAEHASRLRDLTHTVVWFSGTLYPSSDDRRLVCRACILEVESPADGDGIEVHFILAGDPRFGPGGWIDGS